MGNSQQSHKNVNTVVLNNMFSHVETSVFLTEKCVFLTPLLQAVVFCFVF